MLLLYHTKTKYDCAMENVFKITFKNLASKLPTPRKMLMH
jgi:hypothetical protein